MFKAILFDVGGTLITPHPSVGHIYGDVSKRHGLDLSPADLNQRFKKAWKNYSQLPQNIDKSWWRQMVQEIFTGIQFDDFESFFDDLYKEFEKPSCWKIFDEAIPTLKRFKQEGKILAVASNWDNRLSKLLDDLKLSQFFDYQFISFQLGFAKPEPQFFKTILKKLNLPANQILHIGDDIEKDKKGAEALGIQCLLVQNGQIGVELAKLS